MRFLPNWSSIESTSRWSDILFWVGIACLVVLAAAEVASHVLSSRSAYLQGTERAKEQRNISDDQYATLIGLLAAVPKPVAPVAVMSLADREAHKLGMQIKGALEAAGFAAEGVWDTDIIGGTGPGVIVRQRAINGEVGAGIADALRAIGLEARAVGPVDLPNDKIEIFVAY